MKTTPQQYAQALYEAVHETKDETAVLDNFVKILAQNGDLGKFSEIDVEFRKLKLESQGIKEAEVTVAKETTVNKTIIDELNQIVRTASGGPSSGKRTALSGIEIKTSIDESIIGGVVVRVDDTLIDASVRTQLNNLNNSLKS